MQAEKFRKRSAVTNVAVDLAQIERGLFVDFLGTFSQHRSQMHRKCAVDYEDSENHSDEK